MQKTLRGLRMVSVSVLGAVLLLLSGILLFYKGGGE